MRTPYPYPLKQLVAAACLALYVLPSTSQSVIFPQEKQPGSAQVEQDGTTYTLFNDLFAASFSVKDGDLFFDGCDAMNLRPGSELFKITLGDGTTLAASDMTLGEIEIRNLEGDTNAAKGALRLDGKAIEADFEKDNLHVVWRAVLRNGSHYLRTEMEIAANADQPMTSITPMLYDVDNAKAQSAPAVVGNTRGSILASEKIFAGLETPMGINSVKSNGDFSSFQPFAWTASSFSWKPDDETPQEILGLGFQADQIVGTQGYLTFRETGENKIIFQYASGTHRLNIVGVDVLDLDGKSVASDYHIGYTGEAQSRNEYAINIPKAGTYLVRYFVETRTESITSSGNISFDRRVSKPVVIYGQAEEKSLRTALLPMPQELSETSIGTNETLTDTWEAEQWNTVQNVPLRINELGFYNPHVKSIEREINITAQRGTFTVEFLYATGNNGLNTVGVDLVDEQGDVAAYDYHKGFSGHEKRNNTYAVEIPFAGKFKLRYFCEEQTEEITSNGNINISLSAADTLRLPTATTIPIEGKWSRNTTLKGGSTWNISSVVGLIAPGQARRSVLAYSERERAVPWRPYPVYISWYELNIDRNNATAPNYSGNMTVEQCTDIVEHWENDFYNTYGVAPKAFVWDDGWDEYGTWTFNRNFPNGFAEPAEAAERMNAGIGAWLGPVGGYGKSGDYRRNYWKNKGGMQLSNQTYHEIFVKACHDMIDKYDFRFFKFDGISAQFTSVGPDSGTLGEENAEAIIDIERNMRKKKADIFLNTTVGTWASPFWFQFTDAVWRQEADYSTIGNQGSDRERWITYRDRLVYQNFVQRSPLCPINTLMTHGFILSRFGQVSKDMNYDGIVRELRCAFACGSGMVELYNDYQLMNTIKNNEGKAGALWEDLAECIKWQEEMADVLPDIHWVGGNPWDGSKANVYGWASWNGQKATLALRNPAAYQQTFTTTLREALDIPDYINTTIILSDAFDQEKLEGLETGKPLHIDTQLSITLPGSTVYVFNGKDVPDGIMPEKKVQTASTDNNIYDLSGRRLSEPRKGLNIIGGKIVPVD